MKKVMVLGASYLQNWIIDAVHEKGYYAIALDGNRECANNCHADKFYHQDFSKQDEVLKIANKEKIDGILTYASDTAALTVSYIADKMGLPGNPYKSVDILVDKGKTRDYLYRNGFNSPKSFAVKSVTEALKTIQKLSFPIIVKPADACGSKGLSKIGDKSMLNEAFELAYAFSRKGKVIIEEFLVRDGYQLEAEIFLYDRNIIYFEPMYQHQDIMAPFSPIGNSMPIVMDEKRKSMIKDELQRVLSGLDMRFGIFNVEFIFDPKGNLFFLEIAPRGGGNLISEMNYYSSGIMLRRNLVEASMMLPLSLPEKYDSNKASCLLIHSRKSGVYKGINVSKDFPGEIMIQDMFVKEGDEVHEFTNGRFGIGLCVMRFDDEKKMLRVMNNSTDFFKIEFK